MFAGEPTLSGEAVLLDPDDASGNFGTAVAIDGTVAVIGSPVAIVGNARPGSAAVYTRAGGTWGLVAILTASDGSNFDLFGQSVGLSRDTIVIGAPRADVDFVPNQGAAYVFRRNAATGQWAEQAKLTAFGFSVSHTGGSALIGAPFADDGAVLDRGAGYFFTRSPTGIWSFRQKLVAAGDQPFESGGRSVALSGTAALLGRPSAEPDGQQPDAGAVSAWSCGDLIFADGAEVFTGCGL